MYRDGLLVVAASIGHMAAQNMTTLCENWACTFHDAGGGSGNHIMLGGFDPWLHTAVGGLDTAVNGSSAGWEHVIVRVAPAVVGTVLEATNEHASRFGTVSLTWKFSPESGALTQVHTPSAVACDAFLVLTDCL